jgi:hypothetical protein
MGRYKLECDGLCPVIVQEWFRTLQSNFSQTDELILEIFNRCVPMKLVIKKPYIHLLVRSARSSEAAAAAATWLPDHVVLPIFACHRLDICGTSGAEFISAKSYSHFCESTPDIVVKCPLCQGGGGKVPNSFHLKKTPQRFIRSFGVGLDHTKIHYGIIKRQHDDHDKFNQKKNVRRLDSPTTYQGHKRKWSAPANLRNAPRGYISLSDKGIQHSSQTNPALALMWAHCAQDSNFPPNTKTSLGNMRIYTPQHMFYGLVFMPKYLHNMATVSDTPIRDRDALLKRRIISLNNALSNPESTLVVSQSTKFMSSGYGQRSCLETADTDTRNEWISSSSSSKAECFHDSSPLHILNATMEFTKLISTKAIHVSGGSRLFDSQSIGMARRSD